jgi:HD-like signal output (HDOD) protein
MSQLAKSASLKSVQQPLHALWQRSAYVAAMASVVAKRLTKVNADTAALAGILHGIGKLYVLVRAVDYPALFSAPDEYARLEQTWHANIAKALLENWDIAEDVVTAVHRHEDLVYTHAGEPELSDVLLIANLLVSYRQHPESIELNLQGLTAAHRIRLDAGRFENLLTEWALEIEALRCALGS